MLNVRILECPDILINIYIKKNGTLYVPFFFRLPSRRVTKDVIGVIRKAAAVFGRNHIAIARLVRLTIGNGWRAVKCGQTNDDGIVATEDETVAGASDGHGKYLLNVVSLGT